MNGVACPIKVLAIIEADIATTQLIEQILKACVDHGVAYRRQYLEQLTVEDLQPDVIPLIIRSCSPSTLRWVESLIAARRPYIYYIDDNFWKLQGNTDVALYYQFPLVRKILDRIVMNASCVLTNVNELADFIRPKNAHVACLPTFFDFSNIDDEVRQPTNEVRIGFAGSTSRLADLEIIKPLIDLILQRFPQAVFEFAGVAPEGIEFGERVRHFDYQNDYATYIRFQLNRGWRVGLAPLLDTESNRCKTDVKYREYAACGIAGIYSDVLPYQQSVTDGVTGIIVSNNTADWIQALSTLLENPATMLQLGQNAEIDARERYSVGKVAGIWAAFFIRTAREWQTHYTESLPITLTRPSLRHQLEMIHLLVFLSLQEGGVTLVAKRGLRKIGRMLGFKTHSAP
jgi:glycosyltransferase involved in cell wall biosynthesis